MSKLWAGNHPSKGKLRPRYHKAEPSLRVCFKQAKGWVVQMRMEPKGTRERDPWHDLTPPRPLPQALEAMYRRYPLDTPVDMAKAIAESLGNE